MSIKEESFFEEETYSFNNPEFVAVVKVKNEVAAEDETNKTAKYQQTGEEMSSCQDSETCMVDTQPVIDGEKFQIKLEYDVLSVGNQTSTLSPFESPTVVKVENEVTSDYEINETGNSTDSLIIKEHIPRIKTERVDMSPTDFLSPAERESPHANSAAFVETNIIIKKEEDLDADEIIQPISERNYELSAKCKEHFKYDDKSCQSSGVYESSAWGLCEEGCSKPPTTVLENTPFREMPTSVFRDDIRSKFADISTQTDELLFRAMATEEHFSCTYCNAKFDASRKLKRHEKTHTEIKSLLCTYCPAKFSRTTALTYHLRTHTQERPYACAHCPLKFNQNSTYNRHLRVHTKEKPYVCTLCPAKFSQSFKLKAHLRIHNEEKPFSCTFCAAKFRCNSNLKRHVRIHTDEKPFSCTHCPAKFCQSNTLKNHLNTHTNKKPFACTLCSGTFCQKSSLKLHMRVHSDEPFKCSFCPARFRQSLALKSHVKTHAEWKRFECAHCAAKFNQKSHLKYHLRIHTQRKGYSCAFCMATFKLKNQLRKHLNNHSEAEPLSST